MVDGLIYRQSIKYYRMMLREWSIGLKWRLEQNLLDIMRQLRNSEKVIEYRDNYECHIWYLDISDRLRKYVLNILLRSKQKYIEQMSKIRMIRLCDQYWKYVYDRVPVDVIEPIHNLRGQQKMREWMLSIVALYNHQ